MAVVVNLKHNLNGFKLHAGFSTHAAVTGIFGPSGSGKTTLLNSLAGLIQPEQGEFFVNGKTLVHSGRRLHIPVHQRRLGVVFQEGRLFPHLNVRQNLLFGADKRVPSLDLGRVVELLQLQDLLDRRIRTLSGGQQRRVAVGRALLAAPRLLLLDEPLTGLDRHSKALTLTLLRDAIEALNIETLMVSHDLRDILALTDEVVVMQDGTTRACGSIRNLEIRQALHQVTGDGQVPNVLTLHTLSHCPDERLTLYSGLGTNPMGGGIRTIKGPWQPHLPRSQEVRLLLNPNDITLAWAPVEYISMQNQLPGTIEQMVQLDDRWYCVIQVGQRLVAQVTLAGLKQLELQPGRKIWCLFKTTALESALLDSGFRTQDSAGRIENTERLTGHEETSRVAARSL